MKRPQFSLRSTLLLVAFAAILAWLGVTAFQVWRDVRSQTLYAYVQFLDRPSRFSFRGRDAPFWPRYWRRLLGRPWPGTYVYTDERRVRVLGIASGPQDLSQAGEARQQIRDALYHRIDHTGKFASCEKCRAAIASRRLRAGGSPPSPATPRSR